MNVSRYQWGRLLRLSCSGREWLILEWRHSWKEERSQGSGFLGRMSVLGAIDSSEGVSSGTFERCSHGEALLGVLCYLSSGVFDEMRHVFWSWCTQKLTTTIVIHQFYINMARPQTKIWPVTDQNFTKWTYWMKLWFGAYKLIIQTIDLALGSSTPLYIKILVGLRTIMDHKFYQLAIKSHLL